MPEATRTELSRNLGPFTVALVGVGAMVAAGVFVLTGIAAGRAGPAVIFALAANGLVAVLTALAYAELGSALPGAEGGYSWVREALPGPGAFLAGWTSWCAHAVAGALLALGFGAYLGLALDELGWTVMGLAGADLEKPLAVLAALAFVGVNLRAVSETGLAGSVLTLTKTAVVLLFVASGAWAVLREPAALGDLTPLAPEGPGGVLAAMGLTYVAFAGCEFIAQAGEETRDPERNVPRAVFWSLAVAVPLHVLAAAAAVAAADPGTAQAAWAWLGGHAELALAEAARAFMPLGAALLVVGGILATAFALNVTTVSATRVSFAMGRDRNLPDVFSRVRSASRAPSAALAASGGLTVLSALALPLEDLAATAGLLFLVLFVHVNLALITIRREYGEMLGYGFLVPFFPALPVVTIVLLLGLAAFIFRFSPTAWLCVAGWLGIGGVVYFAYARGRERERRITPVVHRQAVGRGRRYRVLVPVANPERAEALIDFAAMVAGAREGEVVVLHAITVPDQTPLEVGRRYARDARERILDRAVAMVEERNVPSGAIIRIGHKPAETIIHEVEEGRVDMVVMGWRGRSRHPRTTIGSNIDLVLRHADCHVTVLRAEGLDPVRRILIPVAYPEQAHLMLEIGELFEETRGAELVLLHAVPPAMERSERRERVETLYRRLGDLGVGPPDDPAARRTIRVEETADVVAEIAARSADFDLTILGASLEGWFRKLVAGTRPEQIARRAAGRLLLVKRRRSAVQSRVLDTVEFLRTGDAPPGAGAG